MAKKDDKTTTFTVNFDNEKLAALSVAERKNIINQMFDVAKEEAIAFFSKS